MTILYFDKEDLSVAEALSGISQPGQALGKFADTDFRRVDVTDITLLAHTDTARQTMGGYTPSQLATLFEQKLKGRETSLQHLYLISCEAGLSADGKPSLAQTLFAEMKKRGFANLQVHTIVPPLGKTAQEMRVEVVTKPSPLVNNQAGHVYGYFYDTQEAANHDTQLENLNQEVEGLLARRRELTPAEHKTLRAKQKEQLELGRRQQAQVAHRHTFFSAADYRKDMQQPQNTIKAPSADDEVALKYLREYLRSDKCKTGSKQEMYAKALIARIGQTPPSDREMLKTWLQQVPGKNGSWKDRGPAEMLTSTFVSEVVKPICEKIDQEASERAQRVPAAAPRAVPVPDAQPTVRAPAALSTGKKAADLSNSVAGQPAPIAAQKQLKQELKQALYNYRQTREKESGSYHFNLLGFAAIFYKIEDFFKKTHHVESKKRETKLSASHKLAEILDGRPPAEALTEAEKEALQEGRLGAIVKKQGGLDHLLGDLGQGAGQRPGR